ncbi:MAG: acyl-CoA dehydrogenase family protein, partial [Phenylobacterium sp.]
MDLAFSKEDLAFRDEVRAFIEEAFDEDMRARMAQSKNAHIDKAGQVRWLKRLHDKGWIAPDWPAEYGGTGWSHSRKYIFEMEMALAGAPSTSNMGLTMCAPVVMAFGTPEQKAEHLPKILSTDVWWCQGYSEPGSGSDLASLSLKAERDGDHYVLNGSKIRTTYAQWADWMFCLVRTSNEAIRQMGISFLLLDMKTPGISIVPLPTLDGPAEGEQASHPVCVENVRVPISNRIGEEGQGWTYAKYLLQFERGNPYAPGLTHQLEKVKRIATLQASDGGGRLVDDPAFRRKLAEMQIKVDTLNATELRVFGARVTGETLGAVSSMFKLEGS